MRAWEFITEKKKLNEFYFHMEVMRIATPARVKSATEWFKRAASFRGLNEEDVKRLSNNLDKKASVDGFETEFSMVELPPGSSIENELRHVDWNRSWGVFYGDECYAAIAVTMTRVQDFLSENPFDKFDWLRTDEVVSKLNNIQGDALFVRTQCAPKYVTKMFVSLLRDCQQHKVDFMWGLSDRSLNNVHGANRDGSSWKGWNEHSVILGIHAPSNAYLFVKPLSSTAKQIEQFK